MVEDDTTEAVLANVPDTSLGGSHAADIGSKPNSCLPILLCK